MSIFSGPTPPSPSSTASQQTTANVSTAIANAFLNQTNQVTPQGALTYDQTGTFTLPDPEHPGFSFGIPRFTATQTLSAPEQYIFGQQEDARANVASIANEQSKRIGGILGTSIDQSLEGAPAFGDPSTLSGFNPQMSFGDAGQQQAGFAGTPSQSFAFGDAGNITGNYGPGDFSQDRANVEQALFQRVQPQIELQRNRLDQQLADQGIRYGSPAYAAAHDELERNVNDQRLAITAQAGQEQQRMMDMAAKRAGFQNAAQMQAYQEAQGRGAFFNTAAQQAFAEAQARGQFGNAAQQAAFQQAALRGQFGNAAQAQAYQQAVTRMNAQNAARQQFLAEAYQRRALPINEVTALLSGSQVSQPQWVNTPQTQIPTTDVAGIINQNFNQQLQGYNIQSQLLGNIIGAGGRLAAPAVAPALAAMSDRRMKDDIHRVGTIFAADAEGGKHDLPIHSYTYKSDPTDTPHIGPMAQDVERIDPRAVVHDKRGVKYLHKPRVMGAILRAA